MNNQQYIQLICVHCGKRFPARAKLAQYPDTCDRCKGFTPAKIKKPKNPPVFDRCKVSKDFYRCNAKVLNDQAVAAENGLSYGKYMVAR